jgi:uncharacterized RDD family membrane protein YckC
MTDSPFAMKEFLPLFRRPTLALAWVALAVAANSLSAQEAPAAPAVPDAPATPSVLPPTSAPTPPPPAVRGLGGRSQDVVSFGRDAVLEAGEVANSVVAISASATAEGTVRESIVAIAGDVSAGGPVGDAAVAILGNATAKAQVRNAVVSILGTTRVEGAVGQDVVAVLGDVELGPNAVVQGNVVSIGGTIKRAPGAVIRGDVQAIGVGIRPDLARYRGWIRECLLYARPLAFSKQVGWAWALATAFLVFYLGLAWFGRGAVDKCLLTLSERPGRTLLATILTLLLTPLLLALVSITVVGLFVLPLLLLAMFIAGLFGRTVLLAAIGRGLLRPFGGAPSLLVSVALGGVTVMLLYTVPVAGFLLWKFLGAFGFGLVVYTLILNSRSERPAPAGPVAPPLAPPPLVPPEVTMPPVAMQAAASSGTDPVSPGDVAAPALVLAAAPRPAPAPGLAAPASALARAGFWRRIFALALDALLVALILTTIPRGDRVFLPLLAVYAACLWRLRGTTIGGIILGLKVVRLDDRPMDWTTAVVRALACFLSLVVVFLGFIWVAFDPEKQSWHDKIAGTIVVRVPRGLSLI